MKNDFCQKCFSSIKLFELNHTFYTSESVSGWKFTRSRLRLQLRREGLLRTSSHFAWGGGLWLPSVIERRRRCTNRGGWTLTNSTLLRRTRFQPANFSRKFFSSATRLVMSGRYLYLSPYIMAMRPYPIRFSLKTDGVASGRVYEKSVGVSFNMKHYFRTVALLRSSGICPKVILPVDSNGISFRGPAPAVESALPCHLDRLCSPPATSRNPFGKRFFCVRATVDFNVPWSVPNWGLKPSLELLMSGDCRPGSASFRRNPPTGETKCESPPLKTVERDQASTKWTQILCTKLGHPQIQAFSTLV